MRSSIICLTVLLVAGLFANGQQDSLVGPPVSLARRYVQSVNKRTEAVQNKLDRKSRKLLRQYSRVQAKIAQRLSLVDSAMADQFTRESEERFRQLQEKLLHPGKFHGYLPHWDSLCGAIRFLGQDARLPGGSGTLLHNIQASAASINGMETRLQQAEDIRQFLKSQQQRWKDLLEKAGLFRQLKALNKQVYYYSQQIREYKDLLNTPDKLERRALGILSRTKAFQDFMKRNSMLASLFRLPPDNPGDPSYLQSLAGLQTRAQVSQYIQNQLGSGGPNALQTLQNNIAQAQSQLQSLKDKVNQFGGGSSDMEMPEGFKPNNQKTKTFLQRLVIGTNFQTLRSTNLFPVTSDLGLSIGFKPDDRSILGIGASYKVGWGQNFRNIRVTNQGAGLRSFVDWKIRGNFWLSGGYELNYRTIFYTIDQLKELNAWQQSGLLGLSKKFSVRMKFFRQTQLQLLWDFLSYRQVPRTQPVLFRVGYGFK